jgi:hypothetical protein
LVWHSLRLSPNQKSAFLRRFDSIVSLQLNLSSPNDVASIICCFPHLQNLYLRPSLRCYQPSPRPLPLSPELRLPERLSTLRATYLYQDYRLVLKWLASIPEQLSIHTLHLSLSSLLPQDLYAVNMFLKALGPSLEVFRFSTEGKFTPSAPIVEQI